MAVSPERLAKHQRVADFLDEQQLDAVLLSRRCNFSWYTCGARNYVGTNEDAGNSTVLVSRDGAVVIANNIEAERIGTEELPARDLDLVSYSYADSDERGRAFAGAIAGRTVAADVPLGGIDAKPLPAAFNHLRWSLLPEEIERYRVICADTVAAVEEAARSVRPGETEHQAAGRLAGALRSRGLLPWVLLAAADERLRRFRHPLPTDTRAERLVMLVTCAERGGLIAACSRIASFGPISDELADRHRAVATVDAALISATEPGRTLGEIFDVAREAYAAVGHADEWRNHHQGGSIGYLPRDVKAAPGEATEVQVHQPFAWNPSIAGTKSEDTVLCLPDGAAPIVEATDWPTVEAEWQGFRIRRADILVR